MVVRISWPGGCDIRRLSSVEGDSIRIHVEPSRQVSHDSGEQGWESSIPSTANIHHLPDGSIRDFRPLDFPGRGESSTIGSENRTCDSIPSISDLIRLGSGVEPESHGWGVRPSWGWDGGGDMTWDEDTISEADWRSIARDLDSFNE